MQKFKKIFILNGKQKYRRLDILKQKKLNRY